MAFYDRLGSRHDWFEFYEGEAKKIGLEQLKLAPGNRVLNAGSGTGKEHLNIVREVSPGGLSVAARVWMFGGSSC
jgi:cyclopropane fatty-acyl-phospholipid synthase-like methyltransferase